MEFEKLEEVEKINSEAQTRSILNMSPDKLEEEIKERKIEVEEDSTVSEKRELLARNLMSDENFEKFFRPLRSKKNEEVSEKEMDEFVKIEDEVDEILVKYKIGKDGADFIKDYIGREYLVAITNNPKSYRATISELAPLIADKYKSKTIDIETEKENIIKIIEGVAEKNNFEKTQLPEAA